MLSIDKTKLDSIKRFHGNSNNIFLFQTILSSLRDKYTLNLLLSNKHCKLQKIRKVLKLDGLSNDNISNII